MKVYFEDGPLTATTSLELGCDHIINAACGYSANEEAFDRIRETDRKSSVYTNSMAALISAQCYCWDTGTQVFELYIRSSDDNRFTRIDSLTDRQLRFAHNIANLWLSGAFK